MKISRLGVLTAVLATLMLCLGSGIASGSTHLNLTLNNAPDIVSGFIDVSYDAGVQLLSANGFALEIDDDGSGPPEAIAGGTFDLTATIDNTGNLIGGTIAVGGTVATLGFNSGTLLTGDLTAFGYPSGGGDPLEFLFGVTGGDAAPLYGSTGGTILTQSGFGGTFSSSFANSSDGLADTGTTTIPIPSALPAGLSLLCVLGVAAMARKMARRSG